MSFVSQTIINEYRDEQIHFLQLHLGGDRNFCYVLGELRSGQAAVVDPGFRANQLAGLVAERRLGIQTRNVTCSQGERSSAQRCVVPPSAERESQLRRLFECCSLFLVKTGIRVTTATGIDCVHNQGKLVARLQHAQGVDAFDILRNISQSSKGLSRPMTA
jgi:hypothetical protein